MNPQAYSLILRFFSASLSLVFLLYCSDAPAARIPVRIVLIMHGNPVTGAGSQTHALSKSIFRELKSLDSLEKKQCTVWLENGAPTAISSLALLNPFFLISVISKTSGLSFETIIALLLYPESFDQNTRLAFDKAMRNIYEQRIDLDAKFDKKNVQTVMAFETSAVAFLKHRYGDKNVRILREEATYESWLAYLQSSILNTASLIFLLKGQNSQAMQAAFEAKIYMYRSILYRDRKLAEDIRRQSGKNDSRAHFVIRGALHEFLAPELSAWKIKSKTINIGLPGKYSFLSFIPRKREHRQQFNFDSQELYEIHRSWIFELTGRYYSYFKKNIDYAAYIRLIRAVDVLSEEDTYDWLRLLKTSVTPDEKMYFENQKLTWNFLRSKSPEINSLLN